MSAADLELDLRDKSRRRGRWRSSDGSPPMTAVDSSVVCRSSSLPKSSWKCLVPESQHMTRPLQEDTGQ